MNDTNCFKQLTVSLRGGAEDVEMWLKKQKTVTVAVLEISIHCNIAIC